MYNMVCVDNAKYEASTDHVNCLSQILIQNGHHWLMALYISDTTLSVYWLMSISNLWMWASASHGMYESFLWPPYTYNV
jgi:hypothetical protein